MSRFTLVSRHGLLPRTHRRDPSPMRQTVDVPAGPLDSLVAQVRALVDADGRRRARTGATSSTPCAPRPTGCGAALDEEEQAVFARDHGRAWEVARHRMPPAPGRRSCASCSLGRAARRTHARRGRPGRLRHGRELQRPGPGHRPAAGTRSSTRCSTAARSGRTASAWGWTSTRPGGSIDATGEALPDVFAVGPARRGLDWEVTAVPDLRTQALEVAEEILPALAGRGGRSATA